MTEEPESSRVLDSDPKNNLVRIEKISQNARTTWFGLLGVLAFVGITLMSHKDADFFARDAATQLPLVNVQVPVTAFFIAAPILVATLYAYLHLYLITLWENLAKAPARPDGNPLLQEIYPWLLSQSVVRLRAWRRNDKSAEPSAMAPVTMILSLAITWAAGLLILGRMWTESWPNHSGLLTTGIGACLLIAGLIGVRSFVLVWTLMGKKGEQTETEFLHKMPTWLLGTTTVAVPLISVIGWECAQGGAVAYRPDGKFEIFFTAETLNNECRFRLNPKEAFEQDACAIPPRTANGDPNAHRRYRPLWHVSSADLSETQLTTRPADWLSFELWLRDFRLAKAIEAGGNREAFSDTDQTPLIPTEDEIIRWRLVTQALDAPQLKGRDLRHADLSDAFLAGAYLLEANLAGADMRRVQLQGARMEPTADNKIALMFKGSNQSTRTNLRATILINAQMQGADLAFAQLQGAILRLAEMQGANLTGALMQGADLSFTQMQQANLEAAELQRANLESAKMHGVDLSWAQMQEANLGNAQLQGAYLAGAKLNRAHLRQSQLQGADIRGADMPDSNCSGAEFLAALALDADLTCARGSLANQSLALTVGNEKTKLPRNHYVWSCLDQSQDSVDHPVIRNMDTINALISIHPETGREFQSPIYDQLTRDEFHNRLFCDSESDNPLRQRPHKLPLRMNAILRIVHP